VSRVAGFNTTDFIGHIFFREPLPSSIFRFVPASKLSFLWLHFSCFNFNCQHKGMAFTYGVVTGKCLKRAVFAHFNCRMAA
jgi:hypothetical protein